MNHGHQGQGSSHTGGLFIRIHRSQCLSYLKVLGTGLGQITETSTPSHIRPLGTHCSVHFNCISDTLPLKTCAFLVHTVPQEQDGQPEEEATLITRDSSTPTSSALEEMALYSSKRKLRHGRRSLEAAVPT